MDVSPLLFFKVLLMAGACLASATASWAAAQPLTVQLKWRHQYQFAGCYVALEQGYYADAGLHVVLKEWNSGRDPVEDVLTGMVDVGIGAANILEARMAGKPVVALAAIFQRSPLAILALKSSGIATPQDVAGKRVAITRHSDLELWAMLRRAGVRMQDVILADNVTARLDDLLTGKVDAISGYLSTQALQLQARGLDPVVLRPAAYDIEFYGDTLFTSEAVLRRRAGDIDAFVSATLRGWQHALDNPDETVDLILRRYAPEADRAVLLQEAEAVRRLIAPDWVPVGSMEALRWRGMAQELRSLGYAGDPALVDGLVHTTEAQRLEGMRRSLLLVLVVAAVALAGVLALLVVNRRLTREVQRRRAAEAEAQEKGGLLEAMLHQLPVFMLQVNAEQEVLFCRGQGLRRLGLEDDALVGRRLDLVFPHLAERLARAQVEGSTSFVVRGEAPDSPWQLETYAFQDQGGRLTGFSLDSTAVMQAEQVRARLVTLIESSPDIVFMAQASGEVLYLNNAGREFYGQDVLDGPPLRIPMLHPSDVGRRIVAEAIPVALREGVWIGETVLRNSRGQERPVSQAFIAHRESDGTVQRLSAICRDLSKRLQMEEELKAATRDAQAASQAKSEFLAHMSHEVRTPLNGMLGMLQLLSLTSLTAEQREYVDTGLASGRGLVTILSDILDLSRVEAGRLTLEEKPLDLRVLVEEVASLFLGEAQAKGLSFDVWVDPATPETILGDAGRLRQVLFNLLGNAVKFTASGSVTLEVVSLRTSEDSQRSDFAEEPGGGVLVFQVADTGPGINEADIPQLFGAFVKKNPPAQHGDGVPLPRHKGAGLGLTVVARLVKLMGGSIQVVSRPGEGSEFTVTLPCASLPTPQPDAAPAASGAALAPTHPASPMPLRILVAEDEPTNRYTMETFLSRRGHHVATAANGQDALAKGLADAFDLILLDIQLPLVSGLDVARQLRDKGVTTPIVAITAFAMQGDRERFLEAGMNDYLSKPLDFRALELLLKAYAP
ncbi:ABC transporter substrate-binding protein [Megalodesulfovibrio gigas]|uniref:histidine kinase n=1 Tax=Megalodesulfovibrio gigas (strain ATCC 19364 / DSM 1382 / NCIMB 9332 / VKM B-1759) TaxID=1121448 RepID=T2G9Z0_MEGG1|nr:ABC transporter substrate-binding protein [Megalodesulfovibrio gigas]AGW13078.1 putative PAS domain S-box [Megalodesulfovibrio gigas DSM 1382 = ATCC 19364]